MGVNRDTPGLQFQPLTRDRWGDFETLFTASSAETLGNPSRCWCMEWRRPGPDWQREAGEGNRSAMEALVRGGEIPGILAYLDSEPVGWCSVSPRASLSRLVAEGEFRYPDRGDVWSIICFYVAEKHHGRGIMKGLLAAAVEYASSQGARIVEAYPTEPEHFGDGAGGSLLQFEKIGFVQVHRISNWQVTVRYHVEGERRP